MKWFLIERNGVVMPIWANESDPLYGLGSWNLYNPFGFDDYEDAVKNIKP